MNIQIWRVILVVAIFSSIWFLVFYSVSNLLHQVPYFCFISMTETCNSPDWEILVKKSTTKSQIVKKSITKIKIEKLFWLCWIHLNGTLLFVLRFETNLIHLFLCIIVKSIWLGNEICEQSVGTIFCIKMDKFLKHKQIIFGAGILDIPKCKLHMYQIWWYNQHDHKQMFAISFVCCSLFI
jgi:hypothetical protein